MKGQPGYGKLFGWEPDIERLKNKGNNENWNDKNLKQKKEKRKEAKSVNSKRAEPKWTAWPQILFLEVQNI